MSMNKKLEVEAEMNANGKAQLRTIKGQNIQCTYSCSTNTKHYTGGTTNSAGSTV